MIADLARAGIVLWMLTGDKEETAINIGEFLAHVIPVLPVIPVIPLVLFLLFVLCWTSCFI